MPDSLGGKDQYPCHVVDNLLDGTTTNGQASGDYARLYAGDLSALDLVALFEQHGGLLGGKDQYPCHVVCPWHKEHTNGQKEAAVWQTLDDAESRAWPRFRCLHDHCKGIRSQFCIG
jgi:hypothetical protein